MEEVVVEISPQYNNCSFHTLVPEFVKNWNDYDARETFMFSLYNILQGGITAKNIALLEEMSDIISAQGKDKNQAMVYILMHSPGY